MDKISIIIPCRNEEKYIGGCLDSVVSNDYPKDFLEVFVVDGKSTDRTGEIVEGYSKKYEFIHLLVNENKTVPYAMNQGIKESTGDFIIRLDAHGVFPNNYFSKLIYWSKKLDADNVGALWITDVKNKNPKSCSIKKVLSNKFGVGDSLFRIGVDKVTEVDTVPFGCYRKEVFEKVGLYDVRLERDQDIELNKRLKKSGGKIFLLPELSSIYYARETFSGIAKNILDYVNRKLTSPEGGFFSAEDAESSIDHSNPEVKQEGEFYAWKKAEIDTLLGEAFVDTSDDQKAITLMPNSQLTNITTATLAIQS